MKALLASALVLILLHFANGYNHHGQLHTKTSNMVFYIHTKLSKPNETARVVASTDGDYVTTTKWGTIGVGDILLTEEQSNTSKAIGRLKSMVIIADVVYTDFPHAQEILTAVIETDQYNGTFCINGRDVAYGSELAIVGGTGDFRGVKGWANFTHVEINSPDSVTFVNATLVHPLYSF